MDIKDAIKNLNIDVKSIQDEHLRGCIILLMNAVEHFSNECEKLGHENQALKDEINRLKGEQGKPKFPLKKKGNNHSSESDRKSGAGKKGKNSAKRTKADIKIDRVEYCDIDETILPDDAIFKGVEKVVIQDIVIKTDNVMFERAAYYSLSENKTYLGELPDGYKGRFGPGIKSLVLTLYQDGGMTEPALKRFLETHGIHISSGTISNIITRDIKPLHQEKTDIVDAGLDATDYHHLDDTKSPVNGKNYHTHILCSPFFTAYFTLPFKDRLAALEVLSNGNLKFQLNKEAYQLMGDLGLAPKRLSQLKALKISTELMTKSEIDEYIKMIFPTPYCHVTNQKIIREAAAIIAYQTHFCRTDILLTDGARQFQQITQHHGLCWIHEGRHYKKLNPMLLSNRNTLASFQKRFWDYYHALLEYNGSPSKKSATKLSKQFDELFSMKTGYHDLDARIASTLANKEKLLLVLRFPHLPLHNNPAELGARVQARKRDISLQTKNLAGTQSKDTLMTIIETAKKLGVNTFSYIYDRMSDKYNMPSLADLIKQHSLHASSVSG